MLPPQLCIDCALVQHYFLDVRTQEYEQMRDAVIAGGQAQSREQGKSGPWRMFVWLDRPAIWAVRAVGVTSGLDTFLLEQHGLDGLRDVAELLTGAIGGADSEDDPLCGSWQQFSERVAKSGVVFATFLWPNWDVLLRPEAWGGNAVPTRSQILATVRRSLGLAVAGARSRGLFRGEVPLLLCASVGDSDLVLYGSVQASRDLDVCLSLLTQMGSDVLAAIAFGPERARSACPWPVFRASRTEMALDLDAYLGALAVARGEEGATFSVQPFAGGIFPEIGLTRGDGPIPNLTNRLAQVAGDGWRDRAVFGREDFVIAGTAAHTLQETIELLARLDAAADDPAFPRRSSIRLGIGSLAHGGEPLTRADFFGPGFAEATEIPPRIDDLVLGPTPDLAPIQRLIVQLRTVGWREELRIIERMTERCVTLLRSSDTRRETRIVLRTALERIAALCAHLEALENAPLDLPASDPDHTTPSTAKEKVDNDIRRLRTELLQSGMSLDRVLSHHSKGAVALLLETAPQARGAEHIGSEVGLSRGLGVLFRGPALRILERVRAGGPMEGDRGEWLHELEAKLHEVATPIIYASQEPDFYIRQELTLLRVPRWALWYPAAASHLIHELGHSLAVAGSLSYLMGSVIQRLNYRTYRPGKASPACPRLAEALAALGEPTRHEELFEGTAQLGRFARMFFKVEDVGEAKFAPHPGYLRILEEIVCDVVARLFSYPDAAPGDKQQLWDCFDYLAPLTARNGPRINHTLLWRLLSAHIAVRQLREIRRSGVRPLSRDGRQALWSVTESATRSFLGHLHHWAGDFAGRGENGVLPRACHETIASLPQSFEAAQQTESGRENLFNFQMAGHQIALILNLTPLRDTEHQSLFKSTHLWGNLVAAACDTGGTDEAETPIISHLRNGCVPAVSSRFPERLLRAVAWGYRGSTRREVPAHVRLALSFYLSDLSHA